MENLFIGYPLDRDLEAALFDLSEESQFFVGENPIYLQEGSFQGHSYLGKKLSPFQYLENINLVEENIYSLLNRLFPNYPFQPAALQLFPLEK